MTSRHVTEQRQTLGALLRLPYEALSQRVYGGLAEEGFGDIRPAHSAVLRHILPEGSRVVDLAERAGMTKQSMAYLVEALAAGGYLSVRPDASDRRAKLAHLTPRGVAAVEVLIRRSAAAEADMAARMGEDRVLELRRLLADAAAALHRPNAANSRGRRTV